MDHPAALHRIRVGVPATVEHSSEAGPETGKWVAQTTQVRRMESCISRLYLLPPSMKQSFITFMDALKLRLRAKDQLHPILQELVTGYARFKGSKDWEGRSKMVSWYDFPFHCRLPTHPNIPFNINQAYHSKWNESIGRNNRGAVETGAYSRCRPTSL